MALQLIIWDEMVGLQKIWPQQQLLYEQCPVDSQGQQLISVWEQLMWGVSKLLLPGQNMNQVMDVSL